MTNNSQIKHVSCLERVAALKFATYSESKRGHLTVLQIKRNIPFPIARIFYIYGTPKDCERGAHAHRETEQVFIAVSGSFSLDVCDARQTKTYELDMPTYGVYVPPMIWARIYNFSAGAVCLVLANTAYDPADYVRDWNEYVSAVRDQGT